MEPRSHSAGDVDERERSQEVRERSQDRREQELEDQRRGQDSRSRDQDERDQLRDLFVGILAHDLNNPLSAISMGAALLLKTGTMRAREARVVARMASAADRMRRMIDELVDVTRIRMGPGLTIERQWTDVVHIVREVVDETVLAHPGCSVEMVAPKVAPGRFDPGRIGQAVSNLLSNAIAYGTPEAPILVRVESQADRIRVEVRNQGEPIPVELIPVLFDPFRSGRQPGRYGRGLGLGLFIARAFIEAHGGRLDVESSAGSATSFWVSLPQGDGVL
jgi:signal transduction histidine kinase